MRWLDEIRAMLIVKLWEVAEAARIGRDRNVGSGVFLGIEYDRREPCSQFSNITNSNNTLTKP